MGAETSETTLPSLRPVSVRRILEDRKLAAMVELRAGRENLDRVVTHPRIQKSGLVLVGHTRGIVPTRIQILGETEISYLESLDDETLRARIEYFYALNLSLVVVTRGVEPLEELVRGAERTNTPLVVAEHRSSRTINAFHAVLDQILAPSMTLHGVLVDVHGIGMLLTGPSGIGKSECALFLVERGHRLVADDRVRVTLLPNGLLVGSPMPLLRHHLEVRGIGILNVADLFGATAVRDEAVLDLLVELTAWDDAPHDRLGVTDLEHDLLGVTIPKLRIPVRPGRDMAVILEVAARNELLKRAGHHAAKRFAERVDETLTRR